MTLGSEEFSDGGDDVFDYVRADTFISATSWRPYNVGFRTSQSPVGSKPSTNLKGLLSLSDESFRRYLQQAAPHEAERRTDRQVSLQAEIATLQAAVLRLEARVADLTRSRHPSVAPTPRHDRPMDPPGYIRGLDVDAR